VNKDSSRLFFFFPYFTIGNDIKDVEQELDIVQLDYKGKVSQGPAKLEDYYTHLIRLFSETNAHEQVIAVAKLALAELSNVS